MCVPLILEHYAENIVPVTSMAVQTLRTGYEGGACFKSIVYRPVVDDDRTQTGSEYDTIYAISSDFGDRMITQSTGLMVLLSEHF